MAFVGIWPCPLFRVIALVKNWPCPLVGVIALVKNWPVMALMGNGPCRSRVHRAPAGTSWLSASPGVVGNVSLSFLQWCFVFTVNTRYTLEFGRAGHNSYSLKRNGIVMDLFVYVGLPAFYQCNGNSFQQKKKEMHSCYSRCFVTGRTEIRFTVEVTVIFKFTLWNYKLLTSFDTVLISEWSILIFISHIHTLPLYLSTQKHNGEGVCVLEGLLLYEEEVIMSIPNTVNCKPGKVSRHTAIKK